MEPSLSAHTHTLIRRPSLAPWHETASLTLLSTSHSSILAQESEKVSFVRSEVCYKIWQPSAQTYKSFMPFSSAFLSTLVHASPSFHILIVLKWISALCGYWLCAFFSVSKCWGVGGCGSKGLCWACTDDSCLQFHSCLQVVTNRGMYYRLVPYRSFCLFWH